MSSRTDAYAAALLEIAKAEGSLETVEDELFKVARTLEANDQLLLTLTDQAIPVERRQGIVEDLFGGKASSVTTALVSFLVGVGRGRDLPAIIDKLVDEAPRNVTRPWPKCGQPCRSPRTSATAWQQPSVRQPASTSLSR